MGSIRRQFRAAAFVAIWLTGALVLLVIFVLFPFVTLTYGDVPSYLEVNGRPEAHLYYPGSRVLEVDISGESPALEGGPLPAHASALRRWRDQLGRVGDWSSRADTSRAAGVGATR